jgi:hypothetical protein
MPLAPVSPNTTKLLYLPVVKEKKRKEKTCQVTSNKKTHSNQTTTINFPHLLLLRKCRNEKQGVLPHHKIRTDAQHNAVSMQGLEFFFLGKLDKAQKPRGAKIRIPGSGLVVDCDRAR